MKIGKSEKKHFCDKNLAALKGSTERDHQVVGEAKRACKNCGIVFKRTTHHSGGNALQDSLTGRHRWPREAGDTSLHRAEHLPSGVGWHVEATSLARLDCSHRARTV